MRGDHRRPGAWDCAGGTVESCPTVPEEGGVRPSDGVPTAGDRRRCCCCCCYRWCWTGSWGRERDRPVDVGSETGRVGGCDSAEWVHEVGGSGEGHRRGLPCGARARACRHMARRCGSSRKGWRAGRPRERWEVGCRTEAEYGSSSGSAGRRGAEGKFRPGAWARWCRIRAGR